MRELLLVLQFKSAAILKGLFRFERHSVVRITTSLIVFGGFSLATFYVARGVTAYLLETAHIGTFLYHRFLSMMLYVFFVTVNVGNMIVCYATLYRSQEVAFMMSLPISHAKIFLLKFVDNFFYSSSTLAMLGIAALAGYGSYFEMPWFFYPLAVLTAFLPFMLIAGVAAVVVLMAMIKVASRIGVRLLLVLLVTLYLSAVYCYFQITNPILIVSEVMRHYPDVNAYFGYLDPPLVRYLPNHWLTEFLYWSVNNNIERALPHLMILLLTTIGFIAVAGLLARRFYYRTWLIASDAHAMKGSRAPSSPGVRVFQFGASSVIQRLILGTNPQREALFKRDFWMFFRDPGQWLHFLLMLLLMTIFIISVQAFELKMAQPFMRAVTHLVVFLFNGFLVSSIALRFVFPAVSLEGEAFWSVRASPLDLKKLYLHKLAHALTLTFLAVELLVLGTIRFQEGDAFLFAMTAFCGGCTAMALTSLHLGAGTYYAIFTEKNPVRVASSHGASLTFLGSMIYLGLLVMILVVPLITYFESIAFSTTRVREIFLGPLAVIAVMSGGITLFSTRLGLKAIGRDF
jgi:ABC-2 type transport system permease protein